MKAIHNINKKKGIIKGSSLLFAPDPESVCLKEKVLKNLQLSPSYCKSFADSWPLCCFN